MREIQHGYLFVKDTHGWKWNLPLIFPSLVLFLYMTWWVALMMVMMMIVWGWNAILYRNSIRRLLSQKETMYNLLSFKQLYILFYIQSIPNSILCKILPISLRDEIAAPGVLFWEDISIKYNCLLTGRFHSGKSRSKVECDRGNFHISKIHS